MIKKHIPVLVVGLLIVLVALAGGAVYGINKLIPSRKQMDLTEYYEEDSEWKDSFIQAALEPFQYEDSHFG